MGEKSRARRARVPRCAAAGQGAPSAALLVKLSLPSLAVAFAVVQLATVAAAADGIDFNRDIRPILAEHCFACHGPDASERKAKLRLDTREGALSHGESGERAIVPGQSAKSEAIVRMLSTDRDEMMPPPKARTRPTPEQVALLQRWVDAGAEWGQHWAFVRPQRSEPPPVREGAAPRPNAIEGFVRARLDREGLQPAPEADRHTLARRLSLDLLGLPPEAGLLETFVRDERADAYERLVDTLLASPHFGERWGRHWLDLARYADSDGYLNDSARPYAYVYRDWVIEAINRDLPLDRFTVEQLAGDLLPGATIEQKIATGFHRNTMKNGEAGADREEDRCKVAVDRVATTGAVWLGLTVGCAECHTHKFDPITQREFYQLYAFFNRTDDVDIAAPSPAEAAGFQKKKAAWEKEHAGLEAAVKRYIDAELPEAFAAWQKNGRARDHTWTPLLPEKAESAGGATLTIRPDATVSSSGKNSPTDVYTITLVGEVRSATGLRLEALGEPAKGRTAGRGRTGGAILSELSVSLQPATGKPRAVKLAAASASDAAEEAPVAAAIDGDTATGWSTGANPGKTHRAVFELAEPLTLAPGEKLVVSLDQRGGHGEAFRRLRFSTTSDAPPLGGGAAAEEIQALLALKKEERTPEQQETLAQYHQQLDSTLRNLQAAVREHAAKKPASPKTKAMTLGASKPRETNIHIRGDFLRKGDRVEPGVLAVLHPFEPRGATADRLDLANWLVHPENPLTSRVLVNQIWLHLFGRGLVPTVDDFGTRGEPPSHPELLDYLATELVRVGWSRKQMIRQIVTSATYRQSSVLRKELAERDPYNVLLARQSRLRLEAEAVRDVFLGASGLLNAKVGGPSIFPPLPGFVTAVGRDKTWPATTGPEKYRRGLYIHLRRNIPYPSLLMFDAPDSTVTCTRRERSDTPLQALTLLNDPVFFECSAALGTKLASGDAPMEQRLRAAFAQCLSRPARDAEIDALRALYDDQFALTKGDAKTAMIAVTRVLMNLDEFITRE